MRDTFADALYWIASISRTDPWHVAASQAGTALGSSRTVTTEEVLIEVLTAFAGAGIYWRRQAAAAIRRALRNPQVTVVPQSHESFTAGLDLSERRPDKAYSLTDCISMNVMRAEGITDALTNDHHFAQEGFNVLIHR